MKVPLVTAPVEGSKHSRYRAVYAPRNVDRPVPVTSRTIPAVSHGPSSWNVPVSDPFSGASPLAAADIGSASPSRRASPTTVLRARSLPISFRPGAAD